MAAEGYLICAVYTANARLPVPGALVTILKRDPGSASQLLAIRLTDSSGRTAPVAIDEFYKIIRQFIKLEVCFCGKAIYVR